MITCGTTLLPSWSARKVTAMSIEDRNQDRYAAVTIAEDCRSGRADPVDVVRRALENIAERDSEIGAFVAVRTDRALAEAAALADRSGSESLPLYGVPIAVKDNLPVAGEPMLAGSSAGSNVPSGADHEVVARLRAAGAVVVGLTAMPELGAWGVTDRPGVITRNPWNLERTAGGSSGGSAAAVAAGMVPVAQGNDGLGSIRSPAACCGLVGIKPGFGLVPAGIGGNDWYGMAENGPLATTVADAALVLSVMADQPELATIGHPGKLKIGLAVGSPSPIVRVDRHWTAAARTAGGVFASAGHLVQTTVLPYPKNPVGEIARWTASTALDARDLDRTRLQKRSRGHVRLGKAATRLGLVKSAQSDRLDTNLREFFAEFDVVLTPMLAQSPPKAEAFSEKSWLSNMVASIRYAPYAALWNVSGYPAASVPIGIHPVTGTPLAVQIAAAPGREAVILALAAQLEQRRPWARLAPDC